MLLDGHLFCVVYFVRLVTLLAVVVAIDLVHVQGTNRNLILGAICCVCLETWVELIAVHLVLTIRCTRKSRHFYCCNDLGTQLSPKVAQRYIPPLDSCYGVYDQAARG